MKAVIGLGFGDEGKGRVVDYLCSEKHHRVVRFSGGHQAAHNVVHNDTNHVFANFGSGTLRGCPTYWSKFCTVEPVGLLKELELLKSKGAHPKLIIHPKCPITTPLDLYKNLLNDKYNSHGTCGVGFGATLERESKFYSLLFEDLFNPTILKIKLKQVFSYHRRDYLAYEDKFDKFIGTCQKLVSSENITMNDNIILNDNVIFEGSQGLLLDQHYGFFPHVTRSNTGSTNIESMINELNISGSNNIDSVDYYLVTRAYQTRHGNGPMTNEHIPHKIKENPYERNFNNEFQGEFRKSLLDVDLLLYSINKDVNIKYSTNKTLVITCLDLIKDDYRFTKNGKIIECKNESEFVEKISSILGIDDILLSRDAKGDMERIELIA